MFAKFLRAASTLITFYNFLRELSSLSLLVLLQLPTWIPGHDGMSALSRQVRESMWHFCPTSLGLDLAPLLCVSVCVCVSGKRHIHVRVAPRLASCMAVTFFALQTVTFVYVWVRAKYPHWVHFTKPLTTHMLPLLQAAFKHSVNKCMWVYARIKCR